MKKKNKAEIIGFILLLIGAFFWFSEGSFPIEALAPIYPFGQFMLWTGLLIWALGYMQKEKAAQEEAKKD